MIPRLILQRFTFSALLGMTPMVAVLPAWASEKATITAPAGPPTQHTTSKTRVEGPSPFRSLKSGDSAGAIMDSPTLPTVPSLDPKAAREILDKLAKDRDWLLDDTGLEQVETTQALEDAWEIDDSKSTKRSAIERKLLGKDRESQTGRKPSNRGQETTEALSRNSRRGSGDFDGEDDSNRRRDALELRGFNAPGERELNPFQSFNANSTDRADRAFGSQSGFIGGRSSSEFESPFKTAETDFSRRMERLGLTPAAESKTRDPAMWGEALSQPRQMRVDQFTQALGGNSSLSGLNAGNSATATAPTFSTPASSSALFDKPVSDFSKSFSAPSLPAPAARGFDLITTPRVSIQPLPKATF
jgi:hypothetical protein